MRKTLVFKTVMTLVVMAGSVVTYAWRLPPDVLFIFVNLFN